MPRNFTEGLIATARAGDTEALGRLLEQHRERFRVIARQKMDSLVQQRIDPSDIIQQTFLAARRDFHTFQGTVEQQFVVWLNKILEHNISNSVRFHLQTYKRSVLREDRCRLDGQDGVGFVADSDKQVSPSQQLMQAELRDQVLQSIDGLPVAEREAIRLRYLEDRSLDEIAGEMGRTQQAVAGVLKRALQRLRKKMPTNPKDTDK